MGIGDFIKPILTFRSCIDCPQIWQERAKSLKLPTHITIDAGRTQIAPSEFHSSGPSQMSYPLVLLILCLQVNYEG